MIFEFSHSETLQPGDDAEGFLDQIHQDTRLVIYQLRPVSAGHWIGFEDMEFRADESLSGDEVAQAIFVLSGGVLDQVPGQLGGYRVEYSIEHPAHLKLVQMHADCEQVVPQMCYFS